MIELPVFLVSTETMNIDGKTFYRATVSLLDGKTGTLPLSPDTDLSPYLRKDCTIILKPRVSAGKVNFTIAGVNLN